MILIVVTCALLTLALGYWIFAPAPPVEAMNDRELQRQALQERKKAIYDNLRDLHFEHLAGKLSDPDFQRSRQMLETEAATVVSSLDRL